MAHPHDSVIVSNLARTLVGWLRLAITRMREPCSSTSQDRRPIFNSSQGVEAVQVVDVDIIVLEKTRLSLSARRRWLARPAAIVRTLPVGKEALVDMSVRSRLHASAVVSASSERPSEYQLAVSKRLTPASKQMPMRPRASSTYA